MRHSFVVQERVSLFPFRFPLTVTGSWRIRDLNVDVAPHAFLGKVRGCSARLSAAQGGYSTIGGLAPTFILESGR